MSVNVSGMLYWSPSYRDVNLKCKEVFRVVSVMMEYGRVGPERASCVSGLGPSGQVNDRRYHDVSESPDRLGFWSIHGALSEGTGCLAVRPRGTVGGDWLSRRPALAVDACRQKRGPRACQVVWQRPARKFTRHSAQCWP